MDNTAQTTQPAARDHGPRLHPAASREAGASRAPRTHPSRVPFHAGGRGGEGGLVLSLWGWRAAQPSCSQEHCVKGAGTEGRGGSSAFTPRGRRGRGA